MKLTFIHCLLPCLLTMLPCGPSMAAGQDATSDTPRTGEFVIRFKTTDLVSEPAAAQVSSVIPLDEFIEWQAYVPAGYDPSKPAGLLVYVSPTPSGELPRGWGPVLDRHNVIWLGADHSGNTELVARRVLFAILATAAARQQYRIDDDRIYITGLSGGGKTASMVAVDQAQLFRGAIYNCGVEFWDKEPQRLDLVRRNRYVFVTGTHDQAQKPTERAYRNYLKAGVENSKLMVVRNMTHRNPDSYEFEEALEYLDAGAEPAPSP